MEHNNSEESDNLKAKEYSVYNPSTQTIIIKQDEKRTNGIGTAGFIVSIIAIFIGWIPILGWLIWLLGLIFSFVGIFKRPRGMAIAGLVISLIGIIFLLFVFGMIFATAALGSY